MLPTLKSSVLEFNSAAAALDYVQSRVRRLFTVPLRNLNVDEHGRVTHCGPAPIEQLRAVRLTDSALAHLDSLARIPRSYASRIDPELHQHSLNELLQEQVGIATVVTEFRKKEADDLWVAAVILGGRLGVDEEVILKRLVARGETGAVTIRNGTLVARFGDAESTVEVLSGDHVRIMGDLFASRWGTRAASRPLLELGVYLFRLVCSNGAYARRALAETKLMSWANRQQVESFLDRHLDRVLSFSSDCLLAAVDRMANSIPEDEERDALGRLLERYVGPKRAAHLLDDAVSWWDHVNVVTATARDIGNLDRQRRLQVAGGALIERFLS